MQIMELSTKTGDGFEQWISLLLARYQEQLADPTAADATPPSAAEVVSR
jgi:hypothetical protein